MAKTLREILIEYANTRGGGLPVTPEEMCNALVLWVQEQFSDEHIRELFPATVGSNPIQASYNASDNSYNIKLKYDSSDSVFLGSNESGIHAAVKAQWIKDNFFNAIDLSEMFEGSDTIVVDLSEDSQHIEIHLDADVVNKIERAILLPLNAPTEPSVPVVDSTNSVGYTALSDIGGGKLYLHTIDIVNGGYNYTCCMILSRKEPITTTTDFTAQLKLNPNVNFGVMFIGANNARNIVSFFEATSAGPLIATYIDVSNSTLGGIGSEPLDSVTNISSTVFEL